MLSAGHYYKLRVNRISDFGLYLSDDEENEVLLPNRYVSLENKVGDELDVFGILRFGRPPRRDDGPAAGNRR